MPYFCGCQKMNIQAFTYNFFAENTYVLYDETKECIIVDPGCYFDKEKRNLMDFIAENNLKPVKLINTHCHLDHIFGNSFVVNEYGIDLYCHPIEEEPLMQAPYYGQAMFNVSVEPSPRPAGYLLEGDTVTFGNTTLDILFAPGHSPGHIVLYCKADNAAIVGDVIFRRSIGRTDLPGGDFEQLKNSILTKIYTLPDDTVLYPGHMETTTVGEEKAHNPFVRP